MKNAFSPGQIRQRSSAHAPVPTPPATAFSAPEQRRRQEYRRLLQICGLAGALGVLGAGTTLLLQAAVVLATNLFFFGRISLAAVAPTDHALGLLVVLIPPLGGLLVGLLARYGSAAVLGHGIPQTMETILVAHSRITPRQALLQPVASAVALGSGAPLGLEGPILQTGGAWGSLLGQWLRVTAAERKVLLAAGAAAGLAALFGTPVAAVLFAIELLLFEFRARSLLPVALASAVGAGLRSVVAGSAPLIPLLDLPAVHGWQWLLFAGLGLGAGLLAVFLSWVVRVLENVFEQLPLHWMWWPVLAGAVVGSIGLVFPQVLGTGMAPIQPVAAGLATLGFILALLVAKAVACSLALGAGTPGGVLTPLLLLGGVLGGILAQLVGRVLPEAADPGLWVVVSMAAVFAGATRAPLTALVLALELTHHSEALLPSLIACAVSELVALALLRHSLLTAKMAQRGVPVGHDYELDALAVHTVGQVMDSAVRRLPASLPLGQLVPLFWGQKPGDRQQAYPVVDDMGRLAGMVTRADLPEFARRADLDWLIVADVMREPPLVVAWPDESLRDAVERMQAADVGQLPVVLPEDPGRVVGLLSRREVLQVLAGCAAEAHPPERGLGKPWVGKAA